MESNLGKKSWRLIIKNNHKNNHLRGSTPLENMIFYLWTDSNKIYTAYVKLKINKKIYS